MCVVVLTGGLDLQRPRGDLAVGWVVGSLVPVSSPCTMGTGSAVHLPVLSLVHRYLDGARASDVGFGLSRS